MNRFIISLMLCTAITASLSPLGAMKRTLSDQTGRRTITFRLDDGSKRTCILDHVLHSATIKNMIQDLNWQDGQELPLPNVSSDVFCRILECLEIISEPDEFGDEFGVDMYLNMLDDKMLTELSATANYLDIKELVTIFRNKYANNQNETHTATSIAGIPQQTPVSQQSQDQQVTIIPAATDASEIPSLFHACAQHYTQQDIYHFLPEKTKRLPADVSKYCASLMHHDAKAFLLNHITIPTNILDLTKEEVKSLGFSPDGKILIFGSENQLVLWDFDNGYPIATFDNYNSNLVACHTSNIIAYLTTENTIDVIDLSSLACTKTITDADDGIDSFCASPDFKKIAYINDSNDTIKIINPENNTRIAIILVPEITYTLCFSPDGKILAYATYDGEVENKDSIILWDTDLENRIATLKGHQWTLRWLCFSPGDKILFSGDDDNTVKLWDLTTYKCIYTLDIENVNNIKINPDGTLLIIQTDDGEKRIFDLTTKQFIANMINQNEKVPMNLSPDGMTIYSALENGGIMVRNLRQLCFIKNILNSELTIEQVKFLVLLVHNTQQSKKVDLTFDAEYHSIYFSLPRKIKEIIREFVILPE